MQIEYDCDIPLQGRTEPTPATATIGTDANGEPGLVRITFWYDEGSARVSKGVRFRRAELYLTNTREIWADICRQVRDQENEERRAQALMEMLREALNLGHFQGQPLTNEEADRALAALGRLATRTSVRAA